MDTCSAGPLLLSLDCLCEKAGPSGTLEHDPGQGFSFNPGVGA